MALDFVGCEVPADEDAYGYLAAGGRVDFLGLHRIKDLLARILRCPDSYDSGGAQLPIGDGGSAISVPQHHVLVALRAGLVLRHLAEEVILARRGHTNVGIGASYHPELERVGSEFLTVLQSKPMTPARLPFNNIGSLRSIGLQLFLMTKGDKRKEVKVLGYR